jgi:hypothetical protein
MYKLVTENKLPWAYSLRNIIDQDGKLLCQDNCESLGAWPTCINPNDHLIDVSCYIIQRDIAIQISPIWNRRARDPKMLPADRTICQTLLKNYPKFGCTGEYSVNYRVASRKDSVQSWFFLNGNEGMLLKYPTGFPWSVK